MTLADMADPHFWTIDRMILGFVIFIVAIGMLRSAWSDR